MYRWILFGGLVDLLKGGKNSKTGFEYQIKDAGNWTVNKVGQDNKEDMNDAL